MYASSTLLEAVGDKINKLLYSKNDAISRAAAEAYQASEWTVEVWAPVSIMRDPVTSMRTNVFVAPSYFPTKAKCVDFIKSTVLCERFYVAMEWDELPPVYHEQKVDILTNEKKREFVRLLFREVKSEPLLLAQILNECRSE